MILHADSWKIESSEIKTSELIERLRWVIAIRWTVVAALLLVGLLGRLWRNDSVQTSLVHLTLAAIVALYNYFYLRYTESVDFGKSPLFPAIRFAQVPADLLVFTVILHYSGGVTGPVFVLYFLYIFVGLSILPPSGAYLVAGTAALCYGILALLEALWFTTATSSGPAPLAGGPGSMLLYYLGYFLTVSATLMITAYIANYFAGWLTRDEGTIRRQLSEINSLYTFTGAMSSTLSSEEVVQNLVNTAVQVEHADACSLLLFNERGESILMAAKGLPAEQFEKYLSVPIPMNPPDLFRTLVVNNKGIYAPDVDTIAKLRHLLLRSTTRSFYALPLMNEGEVMGTLNLSFDKPYTMSNSHWNVLKSMTQQAALAIERTRLFAEAQRAAREMTGLYHIGLATISSLQIDEVLHLIYEQVNRVLHPETFYIALYDEDLAELRYDIFIEAGEALPPFKARLESVGISSWVIRNRKPIFIRRWDDETEQLPFESNVVGVPTQSIISVPLIAKNKIVGVMSVQALGAEAFDQNHLRLLTSIAGQAALALENAKLHETVFEQAQRDSLTGAYNHGTFIDKLNSAIRVAQTDKQTVALIMLDIDHFKQYNDTYGHMVGDDVLRSTVGAIQNHLKSVDVVGRWGGEEFAIILPDVSRAQAKLVAERIRQTVSTNVMKDMHNRSIQSPTVSQGLAVYPEDAVHIEELIDKADAALFRAKDLGRNHIVEWIELYSEQSAISLRASG
ncbi:MAG: GGDEF domain-containing protein [Chloroflexi bacterium]|nr:GGDEF domain-containing protein [Chloroflexota bacterium]